MALIHIDVLITIAIKVYAYNNKNIHKRRESFYKKTVNIINKILINYKVTIFIN